MTDVSKPTAVASNDISTNHPDDNAPHNDHAAVDLFLLAAMTGYSATRLDAPGALHAPAGRLDEPARRSAAIAHRNWRARHPQDTYGRDAP